MRYTALYRKLHCIHEFFEKWFRDSHILHMDVQDCPPLLSTFADWSSESQNSPKGVNEVMHVFYFSSDEDKIQRRRAYTSSNYEFCGRWHSTSHPFLQALINCSL